MKDMVKLTADELEESIKYLGMDRYTEKEWQTIYNVARQLQEAD